MNFVRHSAPGGFETLPYVKSTLAWGFPDFSLLSVPTNSPAPSPASSPTMSSLPAARGCGRAARLPAGAAHLGALLKFNWLLGAPSVPFASSGLVWDAMPAFASLQGIGRRGPRALRGFLSVPLVSFAIRIQYGGTAAQRRARGCLGLASGATFGAYALTAP